MKLKQFALILLALMLSLTIAYADMPIFTYQYGFSEYYEELKENNGGLFRSWSPEDKAELYAMIPSLVELERERVQTISPEFRPDLSVLASLSTKEYVYPITGMLKESEAVALAKTWVVSEQLITSSELDEMIISVSFIANDGVPVWNIAFYDKALLKSDTFINATTGVFSIIDCQTALRMIYDYSEKVGYPEAVALSDLFYKPTYNFDTNTWTMCFISDLNDAGIVYYVNDKNSEIIPGSNG